MPEPSRGNWISFASDPFGWWSLSAASEGRLRVEAYLDCGDRDRNKALFDEFHADRSRWHDEIGFELSWERLDDKRASRIATYMDFDADADIRRSQVRQWAAASLLAMYRTMNRPLRERAGFLKQAAQVANSPH